MMKMRLKELREENKLTQKEVADAVGGTQSNLAKWEKGKNQPPADMVIKLADFFGVTTDYLLGRTDDLGNVVLPAEPTRLAGEADLLLLFRGMNLLQREKFMAYGEGLLDSKSFK